MNNEINKNYNLNPQGFVPYNQRAQNYFLNIEFASLGVPYIGRENDLTITQKPVFSNMNSSIDNMLYQYSLMPGGDGTGPAGNSSGKRDGGGRGTNQGTGKGRGRNRNTSGAGPKTGAGKGNC